jgi:hypothetical protein
MNLPRSQARSFLTICTSSMMALWPWWMRVPWWYLPTQASPCPRCVWVPKRLCKGALCKHVHCLSKRDVFPLHSGLCLLLSYTNIRHLIRNAILLCSCKGAHKCLLTKNTHTCTHAITHVHTRVHIQPVERQPPANLLTVKQLGKLSTTLVTLAPNGYLKLHEFAEILLRAAGDGTLPDG